MIVTMIVTIIETIETTDTTDMIETTETEINEEIATNKKFILFSFYCIFIKYYILLYY